MTPVNAIQNKVCIFDFDGTLGDSMPTMIDIVLKVLAEYHIPYTEGIVNTLMPLGFAGIAAYYSETLGVPLPPTQIFEIFQKELLRAYEETILLKHTVKETLQTLYKKGTRLCVLTASPHAFIDPCLRREGVFELFEAVWSIDDFGISKGDTRLYAEVAKRLSVRVEEIAMVDDSLIVLRTAKAAGATAVGVYESTMENLQAEIRATADFYVVNMSELLQEN